MSAGEPAGEALVDQLDLAVVGYILIKGPRAAQFVRDVIAETTDAVVAKWFNDDAWKVSEWAFKGGAGV
jgi:hypothetical protein